MVNLFQKKRFQMHSGGFSDFKLECDALTLDDYATLAYLVSRTLSFRVCYGIPRGGLPFADALQAYVNPSASTILIADDVFTTGGSIVSFRQSLLEKGLAKADDDIQAIVVFSRGSLLPYVRSIFSLDPSYWQND